nr:hypothetical protein SHINE37_40576 [Rhizobiaceae bacterium]
MRLPIATPPSGLPAISPSRGEIGWSNALPLFNGADQARFARLANLPPFEGEMAGRPEGGIAIGDAPALPLSGRAYSGPIRRTG